MPFTRILFALALVSFARLLMAEDFQGASHALPYDETLIGYSALTPTARIAKLQAQIATGGYAAWTSSPR